jgi:hypothetical protein
MRERQEETRRSAAHQRLIGQVPAVEAGRVAINSESPVFQGRRYLTRRRPIPARPHPDAGIAGYV